MPSELHATLISAIRARAKARRAVVDWMEAEGKQGHLRTNGQAPGWPAYEEAEEKLREAIAEIEKTAPEYWCPTCKEVVDPRTVDDPEVSKVFSLLPGPRHFVEMGDGGTGNVARYHDVERREA